MQSVLLIGRPGSGKGTQAFLLKESLSFEVIVVGDLLREEAEKEHFTGRKLKTELDTGSLLPSIVATVAWYRALEKLKNNNNTKNIIFDGFARKLIETELLLQALDWFELGKSFKVIYINISKEESRNRIRKRKICKDCPAIFMTNYQANKCDKCNGQMIIRGDQTEEAIKKREEEFQKETVPVLEYLKEKKVLEIVNGEQSVEAVFLEIKSKLGLNRGT